MEEVPANESVWKIVMHMCHCDFTRSELLSFRLVNKEANRAVSIYIRFSSERAATFMNHIKNASMESSGTGYQWNAKSELKRWLDFETKLNSLLSVCRSDPAAKDALMIWLVSNKEYHDSIESRLSDHLGAARVQRHHARVQRRPSFRQGIKKVASMVGIVGTGAGFVVSIPLALITLPLYFTQGGQGFAEAMQTPFVMFGHASLKLMDVISKPNLRNRETHSGLIEICDCIDRMVLAVEAA